MIAGLFALLAFFYPSVRCGLGLLIHTPGGAGLLRTDAGNKAQRILGKTDTGNDFYRRESGAYMDSFQFGPGKLSLSLTPPDLQRYPTGNAVRQFLSQGVRFIQLDSVAMRNPAPATRPTALGLDGTNLPRVVGAMLMKQAPGAESAVHRWTEHLRCYTFSAGRPAGRRKCPALLHS